MSLGSFSLHVHWPWFSHMTPCNITTTDRDHSLALCDTHLLSLIKTGILLITIPNEEQDRRGHRAGSVSWAFALFDK